MLAMDLLYLAALLGLGTLGLSVAQQVHALLSPARAEVVPLMLATAWTLGAALTAAVVGYLAMLAVVALVLRLLPSLKAGKYTMGSPMTLVWSAHFILRRVVLPAPLQPVVFSSNVLRFLSLRALRCPVPFTVNMSSDVVLLDPALTAIGSGALLGSRCGVTAHYVIGKRLVLAPVSIGKGTLIAADVGIGPGARIGDNVRIQPRATIAPHAVLGDNVDVGMNVHVGLKATVLAGEVLREGSQRLANDATKSDSAMKDAAPTV